MGLCMKKQPLVAVVGPTASGKTALSIKLAKKYNCEIVSADSMQIYKGMDIATAKPTQEEMDGIPHHLISFLDNDSSFSVADYVLVANKIISEIAERGKLPMVVGGTGLYIDSLIENIKYDNTCCDSNLRKKLRAIAEEKGNKALLDMLYEVDRETALTLHENNLNRIIRALEVYKVTGIPLSQKKVESRLEETPYNSCIIGIDYNDRNTLYDRINKRVDIMAKNGLVEECREVYSSDLGLKTAHQAIGYKELIPYFKGESSLEECIEILKQQTRHYAKRQLTWFRKNKNINWIMCDEETTSEKMFSQASKIIDNSLNL